MVYGYQGITLKSRFIEIQHNLIDGKDDYSIRMSGNGGYTDITLAKDEDGQPFVEIRADNDAFDYDFHQKLVGPVEREEQDGKTILRFETVNRMKGTLVADAEHNFGQNALMLEVF